MFDSNVDLFFSKPRNFTNFNNVWDRMRGYDRRLFTNDPGAESSTGNPTGNIFDIQYGLRVFADSSENYNATTNDPYIQYFLATLRTNSFLRGFGMKETTKSYFLLLSFKDRDQNFETR